MPEWWTHSSGIAAPQMSWLWMVQNPFATGAYPAAASFFMRPGRQLPYVPSLPCVIESPTQSTFIRGFGVE